jgi:hypothetical protein
MLHQLSLPLFDPPSFSDIVAERGLDDLEVVPNRRMRRSWNVTIQPWSGRRTLVVPSFLMAAPAAVKEALIEWATLPNPRRSKRGSQIRKRKAELEAVVWHYVESEHPERVRPRRRMDPSRYDQCTQGSTYDLREVFDTLNRDWFDNALASYVRWGDYASLTSYQTSRTAPGGSRYNLITIAGTYDHHSVPRFAIEGVMYHEMLHIAVPPVLVNGRRVVHGPAFKRAEKRFAHYREWFAWQSSHMRRLSAAMRRTRTRQQRRG